MARSSKPGDSFPLSLVRKEMSVPDPNETIQNAADAVKETSNEAIQDIAEQLKALREQVQALQATTADVASRTGKVMASGARVAGDKVAEGARIAGGKVAEEARIAGDRAVAGAKAARRSVASTVETYPLSTLLIASATAFLLGRITAGSNDRQTYGDRAEHALDGLRDRLHDLSSRLPANLRSALRSSMR